MYNNKVHILTAYHLEKDFSLRLGGQDVYIDDLAKLLLENGYSVFIHEMTPFNSFLTCIHGYTDIGYSGFNYGNLNDKHSNKAFMRKVEQSKYYCKGDLIIYGSDYAAYGNYFHPSIAIQHGIAWDVPFSKKSLLRKIKFIFLTNRKVNILKSVDCMVCVDYNYPNWLRANYGYDALLNKMKVIPNYAVCNGEVVLNNDKELKVVFARRFWKPRGTELVTKSILELSKEEYFNNIKFYLVGDGPEKEKMKSRLNHFSNVFFDYYSAGSGVQYHLDKDVALIPTCGSEGTSLSALEAMSASCAVICTAVGGLSNIVISEHNGLIINADHVELTNAIKRLYTDRDLLNKLKANGVYTIKDSFNINNWKKGWIESIDSINNN